MAGLPPFNFFLFKVGVLAFAVNYTNPVIMLVILFLLLASWYAYQALVLQLLPTPDNAVIYSPNNINTYVLLNSFSFLFLLVLSFFLTEDVFFFGAWLASI